MLRSWGNINIIVAFCSIYLIKLFDNHLFYEKHFSPEKRQQNWPISGICIHLILQTCTKTLERGSCVSSKFPLKLKVRTKVIDNLPTIKSNWVLGIKESLFKWMFGIIWQQSVNEDMNSLIIVGMFLDKTKSGIYAASVSYKRLHVLHSIAASLSVSQIV